MGWRPGRLLNSVELDLRAGSLHKYHPNLPRDPANCTFNLRYILNYLDRNNIASARLAGLETDLKLTSSQYETSVSILFVGYLLMQSKQTATTLCTCADNISSFQLVPEQDR
jgi:hypothetical protein